MGSNMAENHPVGFQWVVEAKLKGAKVLHVDPRFTRTSALAHEYVRIRAGTDIAFLGGVVNYIFENERWFDEYVKAYTNAPVIVTEDFADTEDLDGLFSGWDPDKKTYDSATWQYGAGLEQDPTLQHPRCVFQILRRHVARYTPELVAETCGCTKEQFLEVAETLCVSSGRDKTAAFVYSLGWTQHSVGVQNIRTAAIIQLLLGNMGRPGGGILALRGHASIQGSTDVSTLYNIFPGYIQMPNAHEHRDLDEFIAKTAAPTGFWGHLRSYFVSLLKAYFGENATVDNDFLFDHLPRITGDHSTYQTTIDMLDGKVKGFFLLGENPAVGSANSKLHRLAMAKLDWLVVRDLVEIESASFWYDAPELETGELATTQIPTEVFFLPAASHTEKDGTFTNTQRLLQWRWKALEPKHDCRSDLTFMYQLGERIREKLKHSTEKRDVLVNALAWAYPTSGANHEVNTAAVLREIGGWDERNQALSTYTELEDDGSTTCGCWIYCGCFAGEENQPARRKPHWEQNWIAPEWGWAWPANRRILYNRASADPSGKPWSERKKLVWWDEQEQKWTGHDVPDFEERKPPDYEPPEGAVANDAIHGDHPFIMQADGLGWLFAPSGLVDGPLPTHYEPHESPVQNPLYAQQANPARQQFPRKENRYHRSGSEKFPYAMTSYRLTEHHTAGGMSRGLPHLAELQPEFFCEVSPELAAERGLEHGGWATIVTARTAIEARVMVTDRLKPLQVQGRKIHQVGLPYHWGTRGLTTGDSANDVFPIVLDPNVHIQESKAATCDIRPGRRPRGPELTKFMETQNGS
jgi:formate dehydrogenase major subunit